MSADFSAAFRNAVALQKALKTQTREAKRAASDAAYFDGLKRHEDICKAMEAIASPAVVKAVWKDPRVVRLCNAGGGDYDEVLQTLVWAPAKGDKVGQVISALFGIGGVLDAIAGE
jgi:hypothetical protein